jgi:Putative metallopeptidase
MLKRSIIAITLLASSLLCSLQAHAETPLPKEFEGLTEEQQMEAVEFIFGNAIFVMFHEAGHMLISELELPVLGKEEDAVDTLSSIMLLEGEDETLDKALTDSADGWFLSDNAAQEAGNDYAFWDEHSLDQQRAYAMVCMMVGKDAEGFKEFADDAELPMDRRARCEAEYQSALASWNGVLEPHLITNGSTSKFEIIYDVPTTDEVAPYAELIKDTDLLSIIQTAIGDTYQIPEGIVIRGKSCGEPNAFWDSNARELTFCYELAQFHAGLLAAHFAAEKEQ